MRAGALPESCPDRPALSWIPGECNFKCSRKMLNIIDAILMRSIGFEKSKNAGLLCGAGVTQWLILGPDPWWCEWLVLVLLLCLPQHVFLFCLHTSFAVLSTLWSRSQIFYLPAKGGPDIHRRQPIKQPVDNCPRRPRSPVSRSHEVARGQACKPEWYRTGLHQQALMGERWHEGQFFFVCFFAVMVS